MKSKVKEKKPNEVTLEVEIESGKVKQKINEIYQKSVQEMNIPGFRKGKVPKGYLKARFGDDVFHEDTQQELIQTYLPQALDDQSISPVSEPDVEIVSFEEGEEFVFEATVEILPEIELGDYKNLEIEPVETEHVTEEQVDERISQMQREQANVVPKESTTVKSGDLVTVKGKNGDQHRIRADRDEAGLSANLVDRQVGEEVEAGEQEEDGPSVFTVEEVKSVSLPQVDDEFARDLGHDDLKNLKEKIKSDLVTEHEEERENELKERLIEKIIESSTINPPQKMVDNIVEDKLENTKKQLGSRTFNDLLEKENQTEDEFKEKIRKGIEEDLSKQLVLDKISELEEISLGDDEFEDKIEEEAKARGVEPIKFKNQLKANDRLDDFRDSLRREKALDFLLGESKIAIEEDEND